MSIANSRLNALLGSMEALEDQRKELLDEKKQYMAEAKALGYDTKIVTKILARRKRERADVLEEDTTLRSMEVEIGMEVLK